MPFDKPVMGADHGRHTLEIRIEKIEVLLRRQLLRKCGEIANFAEEHHHIALHVVAQPDVGERRSIEMIQEFARNEASRRVGVQLQDRGRIGIGRGALDSVAQGAPFLNSVPSKQVDSTGSPAPLVATHGIDLTFTPAPCNTNATPPARSFE